jgi:hypothetical protein
MNWKGLILFILYLGLCFLLTLAETYGMYAAADQKTRLSVLAAEILSYISFGWQWFIPLLLLSIRSLYKKHLIRILVCLTPLFFAFLFYLPIVKCTQCDMDWRMYAGYFYKYPYYENMLKDLLIGVVVCTLVNEWILWRKRGRMKKSEIGRHFENPPG